MYSIARKSYFSRTVGNCDFFFLDTPTERGMHDSKDPWKKWLTMLGDDRRQWLLEGTGNSEADFIFVVSSVNFMIPHVGRGKIREGDKNNAWDQLDQPVFVLTGDLHNSFVIKVTGNVWEFAPAPRNSANHRFTNEGNMPATGKFNSQGRECDIGWPMKGPRSSSSIMTGLQANCFMQNPSPPAGINGLYFLLSGCRDLNSGPLAPQTSTLTGLSYTPNRNANLYN